MTITSLAFALTGAIGLTLRTAFSPMPLPTPSVSGLVPDVDVSIFNTPTPTPTPTPIPTPTNTPRPTPKPPPPPTPTPFPTPIPYSGPDMDRWFEQSAREYHVDRNTLFTIAACESNLHATSVNGPYAGMYQFSASAWEAVRRDMGRDADPALRFNPEEAIRTAAFKISKNGTGAWPACSKRIK